MAEQSQAELEWKIEPAKHLRGWWAAGYIYRGEAGTHQGQFVPVFHAPNVGGAGAYVDAMKAGHSRADAKLQATGWAE